MKALRCTRGIYMEIRHAFGETCFSLHLVPSRLERTAVLSGHAYTNIDPLEPITRDLVGFVSQEITTLRTFAAFFFISLSVSLFPPLFHSLSPFSLSIFALSRSIRLSESLTHLGSRYTPRERSFLTPRGEREWSGRTDSTNFDGCRAANIAHLNIQHSRLFDVSLARGFFCFFFLCVFFFFTREEPLQRLKSDLSRSNVTAAEDYFSDAA